MHFKSKEAYRKYNSYRFIHLGPKGGHHQGELYPGVKIHGKTHRVKHGGRR